MSRSAIDFDVCFRWFEIELYLSLGKLRVDPLVLIADAH